MCAICAIKQYDCFYSNAAVIHIRDMSGTSPLYTSRHNRHARIMCPVVYSLNFEKDRQIDKFVL